MFHFDGPAACDSCGQPAAYEVGDGSDGRDTHKCESCVTHGAGEIHGERITMAWVLGDAVARALYAGLTRDDINLIIDKVLDAPGRRFDEDDVPAVTPMDKFEGLYVGDRPWLSGLEPVKGDAR